jgi:3-isopropylmalate dehydratase small subunit
VSHIVQGVTLVLGDRVNTDIHCSSKYMPGKDNAYLAAHAFEKIDPAFPAQAAAFKAAQQPIVLVAGPDFGINSSREQAAQILREMGVAVVVAPSFARAFYRNALNNGLALITAQPGSVRNGQAVEVDLSAGTVAVAGQATWQGIGLSGVLQDIVAAGGLLSYLDRHQGWPVATHP